MIKFIFETDDKNTADTIAGICSRNNSIQIKAADTGMLHLYGFICDFSYLCDKAIRRLKSTDKNVSYIAAATDESGKNYRFNPKNGPAARYLSKHEEMLPDMETAFLLFSTKDGEQE